MKSLGSKMKTFKDYLDESVGQAGLDYELRVYKSLLSAKISALDLGAKPTAGFSNVGSGDIEAKFNGKPFNIEVKATSKDQMGGGSFKYDMETKTFTPVKEMDPNDLSLLLSAAQDKAQDIDSYIVAARKIQPVKYHKMISGIPLKISKAGRDELKNKGLLAKINSNTKTDIGFIVRHYNKKGVYYIQIGGSGLFYMGKNPLNLPVPELSGEIQIEMRLGYSGTKSTFPTTPPTEARGAGLRLQGRMLTKGKSPYSLDNPKDVITLLSEK